MEFDKDLKLFRLGIDSKAINKEKRIIELLKKTNNHKNTLVNKLNISGINDNNDDVGNKNIISNQQSDSLCLICNKLGKYKCPKCKLHYCCVDCYKKHSLDCTESFYKDNVEQVMKNTKYSKNDSKYNQETTKDLVKEYYKDTDKYDNELINNDLLDKKNEKDVKRLEKLLNKMSNEDFKPEYELDIDEWKSFQSFIYNNNEALVDELNLNNYIPFWEIKDNDDLQPACLIIDKSKTNKDALKEAELIEEVKNLNLNDLIYYNDQISQDNNDNETTMKNENHDLITKNRITISNYTSLINLKYSKIPLISQLITKKPSDKVYYSIISVMMSSVYIFSSYLGDINSNIEEVIGIYSLLTPALFNTAVYDDFNTACKELITRLSVFEKEVDLKTLNNTQNYIVENTIKMFKNKFYIIDCLLRVFDALHEYTEVLREKQLDYNYNDTKKKNHSKQIKSHLKEISNIKQKIIFYLSYIKSENFTSGTYLSVSNEMRSWLLESISIQSLKDI